MQSTSSEDTVMVNGKSIPLTTPKLADFIEGLGIDPLTVVAEINGQIVPKETFAHTILSPGDAIELISFVGGG